MAFNKQVKTPAYHSRYQTPFRRRREGKTDYYQRKRLVAQAKNKYASPKYRLVVRFTNKDIIAQIVSSEIRGDIVLVAAYSHELPRYGIKHGLTNWSAGYAVGLLIARRALKKLGLDEKYTGVEEADGEYSLTEAIEDGPRPFKCFLDIGLQRTTTGARIFGVLKGASDGGIYIPHSERRFPAYDEESKESDADTVRSRIFGGHIAEYMDHLADDDEERFRELFKGYLADGIESDTIEDVYTEAHAKIRENPDLVHTKKKSKAEYAAISNKYRSHKLSAEKKQALRLEKIAKIQAEIASE